MEEVPTPRATGPFDVVVAVVAAGVCRTDLHIVTGEMTTPLPLVLGHENAGVVHEVGDRVTNVEVGDSVICYPFVSSGLSVPERSGADHRSTDRQTPGITVNGGYAEFLLSTERSMVKVDPTADLAALATLTDAGITAYRACRRIATIVRPGDSVLVIGVGGLGHLAVQILRVLTAATIIAADTAEAARDLAIASGADEATTLDELAGRDHQEIRAVIDFVGSDSTCRTGIDSLAFGGTYVAVGVGGRVAVPVVDIVENEKHIEGVFVGTYADLLDVTSLTVSGRVTPHIVRYPLGGANQALRDLANGTVIGRAVLEPSR